MLATDTSTSVYPQDPGLVLPDAETKSLTAACPPVASCCCCCCCCCGGGCCCCVTEFGGTFRIPLSPPQRRKARSIGNRDTDKTDDLSHHSSSSATDSSMENVNYSKAFRGACLFVVCRTDLGPLPYNTALVFLRSSGSIPTKLSTLLAPFTNEGSFRFSLELRASCSSCPHATSKIYNAYYLLTHTPFLFFLAVLSRD